MTRDPVDFTHLSPRNVTYRKKLVPVANGVTFLALVIPRREMLKSANILYLHVNRESRKCYIGVTIMRAANRWNVGIAYRNNRRFGHAIKKHGWESFDSFILAFGEDRESLNRAEIDAIAAAGGHKSKFTYNLSPGGDNVAENDKPIVGVFLKTGEQRKFKSGSDAARVLGMQNADMPMAVARGERTSVAGWWFRFADDAREPPKDWGESLRVAKVREKQARGVVAISYKTKERREFSSTSEAAKALRIHQSAVSMVAQGKDLSAGGWWFCFKDAERPMPRIHGSKASREKRDVAVYGIHLRTGERRFFRNCTMADSELRIYKGAAASVASGERTSAADWWFSFVKDAPPPKAFKGALVAKARSKPVIAINLETSSTREFDSAKAAAAELGVSRAAISHVIKGKLKSVKGYRFLFAGLQRA